MTLTTKDDGGAYFPGVVDTFTVVRTENQLRPHESLAPEGISRRSNHAITADGRGDLLLAQPPRWATPQLACVVPEGDWDEDLAESHWSTQHEGEAAEMCRGCPVLDTCLADAMAEERGSKLKYRHLVRGGLTPAGRLRLERTQND